MSDIDTQSDAGAAVDDKLKSVMSIFINHLSYEGTVYGRVLANNKVSAKQPMSTVEDLIKRSNGKTQEEVLWVSVWNDMIDRIPERVKKMIVTSRHWPDGNMGVRAIKQLLEYLMLPEYLKEICSVIQRKYDELKNQYCVFVRDLTANPSQREQDERENYLKELNKRIDRDIVIANIMYDFWKELICGNAIKQLNTQSRVFFFKREPTIENFEKVIRIFVSDRLPKAHDEIKQMELFMSCGDEGDVCGDEGRPEKRMRYEKITRKSFTKQEKKTIKEKNGYCCVGLPNRIRPCPHQGNLEPVLLDVEHRVPFKVSQNDDFANLYPMCGSCHNLKTRFIDKHISCLSDSQMSDYINDYKLPSDFVNNISLSLLNDNEE